MTRILLAIGLGLLPTVASAQGAPEYLGPHPHDLAGHWHLEAGRHSHERLAVGDALFSEVSGARVFLADPIAFGYRGRVWTYGGAHPLPGDLMAYCAIEDEHAHAFAPEGPYGVRGAVHVYRGALHGGRPMLRPSRMGPAVPIVTEADLVALSGPLWFAGCLHGRSPSGEVQPLYGCVPRRPLYRAARRPIPTSRTRSSGPFFNGPGFRTRPTGVARARGRNQ